MRARSRRARRRARQEHRPPRRETRQPVHHQRRPDQDPRLRHRQADAAERRWIPEQSRAPPRRRLGWWWARQATCRPSRFAATRSMPAPISSASDAHAPRDAHRPSAVPAQTAAETMTAILKEDPPQPLCSDVSPALARIVARCLEKTREMRFQSARDLAFGLECSRIRQAATGGTRGRASAVLRASVRWVVAGVLAVALAARLAWNLRRDPRAATGRHSIHAGASGRVSCSTARAGRT